MQDKCVFKNCPSITMKLILLPGPVLKYIYIYIYIQVYVYVWTYIYIYTYWDYEYVYKIQTSCTSAGRRDAEGFQSMWQGIAFNNHYYWTLHFCASTSRQILLYERTMHSCTRATFHSNAQSWPVRPQPESKCSSSNKLHAARKI